MIIVILYALAKMIASERPPPLDYWMKMKKHFIETLSRLKHKINV